MKEIIVNKPKGDAIIHQLASFYRIFKGVKFGEQLSFNLTQLDWCSPLSILPLVAYMQLTGSAYKTVENEQTLSYLQKIQFPKGVDSISPLEQVLQDNKTFIPISVLKKDAPEIRGRLLALFASLILKSLSFQEGIKNAIYYPIEELTNNIFEHSEQDMGFIFSQFYPKKKYLDVCIVDTGIGYAMSYKKEKGLNLSDEDAIAEVMKGHSVKKSNERGYGVRTSKRLTCEGLGGDFVIISGSTMLISNKKEETLFTGADFHWKGVIIAYRIPQPEQPVNIYPYIV
ncbi:MAG: hypothetical protein NTZ18_02030 [Candidatus Komeilibacteria bacterium]|nr:hypothetical protein [Candidatus Komeilibacteria bacterium]